MLITC